MECQCPRGKVKFDQNEGPRSYKCTKTKIGSFLKLLSVQRSMQCLDAFLISLNKFIPSFILIELERVKE